MPPGPALAQELERALALAAERLRAGGLPTGLVDRLAGLAEQVRQPFVLAVVGRIKAGKSSLVNGLLGVDLPTVGVTETTATVNWFRHGPPGDEGRVYGYRRGGATPEAHPIAYLDQLQVDSPETLQLVAGIDRLEFRLPVDWLRPLDLVDTPGLNAVAHEHQSRAASVLGLASQLRKRNEDETARLSREADAVLSVLNPAPKESDLSLLEEFQRTSRGRDSAYSSVAVLGKMDYHDAEAARWDVYAEKVHRTFLRVAARVVPVSVAVDRLARRLAADDALRSSFARMTGSITEIEFENLLDSEPGFESVEEPALPRNERQGLHLATEWTALVAWPGPSGAVGRWTP